ncbi:hypothetical protein NZK35_19790 [Stieleria sp. ICT_E10.1]|uniref:hypothetical protein n=1 Tax=Stieleria sedimenti TaxID=2976331 RepID=UPI0021806116|nr:hypothetical protein [Stieleria sedimenti]MCS7468901.1 hypothetical protein [Stieleria sedimenti]
MKKSALKKTLLGLACVLVLSTAAIAEDAPEKKRKNNTAARKAPAANVLNQLKDVGLTDEQKTEIQAMAKKTAAETQAALKEAGITPEIMKKRVAAQKELRESGKKPAEISAAINEKLGLTKDQIAGLKKSNAMRASLLKNAVALLTEDQKAKLPERLVKMTSRGDDAKGKGKGKGKKKKAEDN